MLVFCRHLSIVASHQNQYMLLSVIHFVAIYRCANDVILCFSSQAVVWSREDGVDGSKDCGNGWRVAGRSLESGQPITAVDIAPMLLGDKG